MSSIFQSAYIYASIILIIYSEKIRIKQIQNGRFNGTTKRKQTHNVFTFYEHEKQK